MQGVARFIAGVWGLLCLSGCVVIDVGSDKPFLVDSVTPPQRLNARSPWYPLEKEQIGLYTNYRGWDIERQASVTHKEIGEQVKRMVSEADELIVASFFLFDNLYADEEPPGDYVTELADLLIARKAEHPSMPIVLILDLFHKAWAHRKSEVVERLVAAGIDVFYSDRLQTRSALRLGLWEMVNEIGREMDLATRGLATLPIEAIGRIPLPLPIPTLDGEPYTVATLANAAYVKANHRKALVIKRRGVYEALTTSWNPHNASLLHENHALSVTGPLACYIYEVLREDVHTSISLGSRYVQWSDSSASYREEFAERLASLPAAAWRPPPFLSVSANDSRWPVPEAAFATEEAIEPILMQWLNEVEGDDRVRIQMFYLSRVPVVHAILDAAGRTNHPIQILLDPNRTGINYTKDGTPNAQVAAYLLERARRENARIEIRWYATRGEQNHAKAMTITNERTGKYLLTLGSANWTRKNLAGINLENNIFVRHSFQLNHQFNRLFDRLWSNGDEGIEYSVAWDDARYNYHHHKGRSRWAVMRRWMLLFPRYDDMGRPELLEQELVHW